MNEQQRLDVLKNEMTDLFELQRGSTGFDNCPTFAFTRPGMRGWVTNPCRFKKGGRIPSKAGYEQMIRNMGKTEYFSLAASPRRFTSTAWLSCEWDIDGIVPDEFFLEYVVLDDLWALITKRINIHWKLTGNRSVHMDVFLKDPIPFMIGCRFLESAKHLLTIGKADKTNLTQCMRLPFSRHQKTNGLCRYSGCHTEDDLLDYIKHIERDDIDEQGILELCGGLEGYLTAHNIQIPIKDILPPIHKATYGIGGKITLTREEVSPPPPDKLEEWLARAQTIQHQGCRSNIRKFLEYVHNGIPEGEFNDVMFGTRGLFPLFVLIMVGVKSEAYAFLRHLACLNVQDQDRITNRLGRLDCIFDTYFANWMDCDGKCIPVEKLKAFDWLQEFVKAARTKLFERYGDKRKVNNLIQVAQYCLLILFQHPEATIATHDVERKLQISHPTAVNHMRVLRSEFPLLRVIRGANHEKHLATDFILNEEFVESILGYSICEEKVA